MTVESDVKQQVREFYNQVGWHEVGEGVYQNARYEDLRPVSREYIHRCHLRVARHLKPEGKYLLDAGSGPIQYPEYLEYSKGYQFRVCADISVTALREARKRIGNHGLFVVADIANLPFEKDVFEGVVSLHTIHHVPADEHVQAYTELYRCLTPGSKAAVVQGWGTIQPVTRLLNFVIRVKYGLKRRLVQSRESESNGSAVNRNHSAHVVSAAPSQQSGTFVQKHSPAWLEREIGSRMPVQVWVWRAVNVAALRELAHEKRGGRTLLRFLYWLEERFPHFLGKNGNYPLIIVEKNKKEH